MFSLYFSHTVDTVKKVLSILSATFITLLFCFCEPIKLFCEILIGLITYSIEI